MLPTSGALERLNIKSKVQDIRKASVSEYPRAVQNFLNAHAHEKISEMKVCRDPISSALESFLNTLTGGSLSKEKAKANYDRIYHLYISFNLGGKRVILEKNQNLTLKFSGAGCKDSISIPTSGRSITLGEFLERGRKRVGDHKFFSYNALSENCQAFVLNLLISNKLVSDASRKFVLQDATKLIKKDSLSDKVIKGITDVAGIADRAYQNLTQKYEKPKEITYE
jgi:hypothetical protein